MIHYNADQTFRGLPLTAEQDSEVRHYMHSKTRLGKPWDTSELQGMLDDMLLPPAGEDDGQGASPQASAAAERAAAFIDQAMEPIEAYEEWNAAMEAESMKGDKR
ncbi:hypothetical protein [Cupriavidus sp. IDO]|jgi:hypothetical protein|uniref:hypothetical protein n=1 Tax=Cupriavidus sp. IDO TaxID=1539142 RepID=UPI0005791962|nr:hypothetical protein [Cupriavidus sp. IDO]KWR90544.1 hypothetical protein RM96_08890 [Cupriavidus sp. IDO]